MSFVYLDSCAMAKLFNQMFAQVSNRCVPQVYSLVMAFSKIFEFNTQICLKQVL